MKSLFEIEVKGGKMPPIHKSIFREQWGKLTDGRYKVGFEEIKNNHRSTRYKYYFDCVLGFALPAAARVYLIKEGVEARPIRNVEELHSICKMLFNPVQIVDALSGEIINHAATTTTMSDRQFIGEFTEKVIEHFASHPFFVEFIDYEDWKIEHNEGTWATTKHLATTTLE